MKKWFAFLLALAILLTLSAGCWADDNDPIRFIQAVTTSGTAENEDASMYIYVDAPDATSGHYNVELGGVPLDGVAESVMDVSFPVTYYCLVDLSGTMYGTEGLEGFPINLAKKTMKGISSRMRSNDHMVIATFDNTIKVSQMYTKGDALDKAISDLAVTDKDTNLYTAISESIKQISTSTEYDTKKCLVIFSDGADLQANGQTSEEVLNTIKEVNFPIYTVATMFAASQLQGGKVMGSFARASAGGEHFSTAQETGAQGINYNVSGDDFAQGITTDMLNGRILIADLSTYTLTEDLNKINLKVTFTSGDDGQSVTDSKDLVVNELPIKKFQEKKINVGLIIGICCGVAIIAAAVTVYLLQRKKKAEAEAAAKAAADKAAADKAKQAQKVEKPQPAPTPVPAATPAKAAKASDIPVAMIQVPHGKSKVTFGISSNGDPFTVGRNTKADVVLNANDGKLSSRHFSLVCSKGSYFIKDENSTNGTFVNGVSIAGKGWAKVNSGDNVRAGETEYRILFGADVDKK